MRTKKILKEDVVAFLNAWKESCLSCNLDHLKTFFIRPEMGVLSQHGCWQSLEQMCEVQKQLDRPRIHISEDFHFTEICDNPARVRLWAFSTWGGEFAKKEMLCAVSHLMILERTSEGKIAFSFLARPFVHFLSEDGKCPEEFKKLCSSPHKH